MQLQHSGDSVQFTPDLGLYDPFGVDVPLNIDIPLLLQHRLEGIALSWARKVLVISDLTTDSGSRFHSGTVRGKNDCLYCSDCERKCLYVWGWFVRVRWSARVRISSTGMATLPLIILQSRARRSSCLRCTSGAHCRSCRRLTCRDDFMCMNAKTTHYSFSASPHG